MTGRPRGQITGAGLAELARRWHAGEPSRAIAAALGIADGYVRQLRARLGLPARRNGVAHPVIATPADEAAAIAGHIARHGVTRCPTAAVGFTSAALPPESAPALRRYRDAREAAWDAARSGAAQSGAAQSGAAMSAGRR